MIGSTISHYKILEKLGGGGMGVVYRAEDTRLKRTVALKFLPPDLTRDPEAKERFIHEAQAASALQHNNICTVHDIDESSDGQLFIVMDIYEGESLKDRIGRGLLKTPEAIDLAIQIALGLAEAHQHGIVHRDIKPANIIITKSEVAKIVDFGLAKLSGRTKLTKAASTLGTIAYMSPEQLQGSDVDARADIFSFGVVFYEMLTGKSPFRGEHEAALMYSITNEEPEPLQKHVRDASSELVHIVNRALEKSPSDRYKTMDDLLIDLRRLRKETSKVSMPALGRRKSSLFAFRRLLLIASAIILAIALVLFFLRPPVRLNPNMSMKVLDIPFAQFQYPGLSPDGKWLAFPAADASGKWDIYNMHVGDGKPKRITADSSTFGYNMFGVDFSPDGNLILYNLLNAATGMSEIRVVSSLGGTSRVVAKIGMSANWRPDGQRFGYHRGHATMRMLPSTSGYKEVWSAKPDGMDQKLEFMDTLGRRDGTTSWSWSPDGRSIAWLRTFKDYSQEVILIELGTGKERQLTHDRKRIESVCWTSINSVVYASNKSGSTTLWMIPADGGEPVQITKEGPDQGMTISDDSKRMVLYRRRNLGDIWLAGSNGSNPRQLTFDGRKSGPARLSPDRKWIAFTGPVDEYGRPSGIYVMDRDGGNIRELIPPGEYCYVPRWSPDGQWIAYVSRNASAPVDSARVVLIDMANPGEPKQLAIGRSLHWIDSRTLLVTRNARTWQVDILTHQERPFFEDSTVAIPVAGQQYVYFVDLRSRTRGRWIIPSNYRDDRSVKPKLLLSNNEAMRFSISDAGSVAMLWDEEGALWRMQLPSGKRERIPGKLPELKGSGELTMSYDAKEVAYLHYRYETKLVIIDNPFK